MKKLLITAILFLFMSAGYAHAQTPAYVTPTNGVSTNTFCTNGTCTYVPLEPLPCIAGTTGCKNGSLDTSSFPSLIGSSLKLLIGAGALIAIVMIVIGALTYMFSDIVGNKKKALDRIRGAMWGIVLLVSSYLILYTINPDLVVLKLNLNPANNFTPAATTQTQTQPNTTAPSPNNSVTSGTANLDAVRQSVCGSDSVCNTLPNYITYDPNANTTQAQADINAFTQNCQAQSDNNNIYSAKPGHIATFPGNIVGAGTLTGAICVF